MVGSLVFYLIRRESMSLRFITPHTCLAACLSIAFASGAMAHTPDQSNETRLDRAINSELHLESSWNTTLRIDDTIGQPIRVQIPIGDSTYTLDLEPQSVRSDDYKVFMQDDNGDLYEVPPSPMRTLRGTVTELGGSLASGSLMEDGLYARIRLGNGEEVWLEPMGEKLDGVRSDLYALYYSHDIIASGGLCGTDAQWHVDDVLGMLANYETTAEQRGTVICTAQLGVDTDYEYYQDWGSGTEARIESVINSVNVQYESEVNLSHLITTIIVRSSSSDPYTSSNAETMLGEFQNEWNSNQTSVTRDVAHLFTGKNIQNGTIGIAYLGVVCYNSSAYGLVESDCCGSFGCTTDLSAHELGHNWGANHQNSPSYNTMYPSIQCANLFIPATESEIGSYVNSWGTCLSCENQAPQGACCYNGNCIYTYETNCATANGEWQGNGTNCDVNPCVAATGACCVGTDCQIMTAVDCSFASGYYNGDSSTCATSSCISGVCCIDTSCSLTLEAQCSGSWFGENTTCADITCGATADSLNYESRTWSRSDGQSMVTYDLYFPSTDPNSVLTAVFGNANPLELHTWSNALFDGSATLVALHQSVYGDDVAHDRALDGIGGIDLVYDSYVTVGSDDAAVGAAMVLGFDTAGFNSATGLVINDGLWFIFPDDPIGTIGAGTALGHLIGSFSIESGQGFEALVNAQWNDGAGVVHQSIGLYWNNAGLAPACDTDLNGDNTTDVNDLLLIIDAWGPCSSCAADIDGSGEVDVDDLLVLIGGWGPC